MDADKNISYDIDPPKRNMRTEAYVDVKQSNKVYTECFSNSFLPRWLKGEQINVNDVCGSQYDDLLEKNLAAYDST